jgi:hypothetical protein
MGKAYRAVLATIPEPVSAVFLDTPAGFELNVDHITAKAVAYFRQRLQIDLRPVSFKSASSMEPHEMKSIADQLRSANFIFAGPGSPTYAVRNLQDTIVWDTIVRRLSKGTHIVLASAAAIGVGRYSLPVYEIYKVGDAPHWIEGLDLLGRYGLDLVIVPHWNNNEGGTHDTRYCFMGQPRFEVLEQLLSDSTTILGIDEYTACILNPTTGNGRVIGAGQVTVRRYGSEQMFPSGAVFNLKTLVDEDWDETVCASVESEAASLVEQNDVEGRMELSEDSDGYGDPMVIAQPFIDLLVNLRAQLRTEQQWALADEIRHRLQSMGIILQDGPDQTTWRID